MIRLDNTTRKLQIILAGAITTNQLPVTVCYSDKSSSGYNGGSTVMNTNSTTAVDICAAPGASTVRDIDFISVNNQDTANATLTIRYNDNGTLYPIIKTTLATGDTLSYSHGSGFSVQGVSGTTGNISTTPTGAAGGSLTGTYPNPGIVTVPIGSGGTGQTTAYNGLDALTVQGSDISSATTTNLATATGIHVNITGTTTITGHGTAAAGVIRILKFAEILTYTHNATSLILPTGANITTAANDTAILVSLGSGNWRCVSYQKADGTSLVSNTVDTIILQDQKTQNTQGGTFTSGAWQTRELNTEVLDSGNRCSLSSNQIVLTTGNYYCYAFAPSLASGIAQLRLYNVTDTAVLITGNVTYVNGDVQQYSFLQGYFTIGSSKSIELQHRCTVTQSSQGFGVACNLTTEIYASIQFWKIG